MTMSALAGLPARAAARVRALNAGAPELAATASGPLRKADLRKVSATALLSALVSPDLLPASSLQSGLTLREARLVYKDTIAVVATLASIIRRTVWRDVFAETADGALVERLSNTLKTLCLMRAPACVSAFLCHR